MPLIALGALVIAALTPASAAALTATARPSADHVFYAYAHGTAKSPSNCPLSVTQGHECSLTQALALVRAGGSVLLASGGSSAIYFGNFSITTSGTSAKDHVTLGPAPGVHNPILSGSTRRGIKCPTSSCEGPVITVAAGVTASVHAITIEDSHNTSTGAGGGLADQGALDLSGVAVTDCAASFGAGADVGPGARLVVRHSLFTADRAGNAGGAIADGTGPAGAGPAHVTVTSSTFSDDRAWRGGGIANGVGGAGTLAVTGSTFADDSARDGGAIDNGDAGGTGTLTVTASTFFADRASRHGAAIDNGDLAGDGVATVLRTTIDDSTGAAALATAAGAVQVAGSIIANSAVANCAGAISDAGYNLESDAAASCGFSGLASDLVGVRPGLRPPRADGGHPPTLRPSPASPVLDQIPNPAVAYLGPDNQAIALCPAADEPGDPLSFQTYGCAIGADDPAASVPVVTSLATTRGPSSGGTMVTIRGGNFAPRATVRFGTAPAAHVTVRSATRITATAPAFAGLDGAGPVQVTVTGPAGRASPSRPADIYSYYPADWSGYLDGVAHSSFNPAAVAISAATVPSLQPIWQWVPPASTSGGPLAEYASPVVSDGVVYLGLEDGELFAVSEATQHIVWSDYLGIEKPTTCPGTWGITSTAAIADDPVTGKRMVYINAPDGYLYAINAASGKVAWKAVVGIPSATSDNYYAWGSPSVANGKVYIGISSNCDQPLVPAGVISVAQHSGKRLAYWDSLPSGAIGGSVWSSIAVLPDGNVVASTGNSHGADQVPNAESIVVLDGSSLKLLGAWMVPKAQQISDSDFGGSPTVFTGYPHGVETTMVGACNKDGIYYAFLADDLQAGPAWEYRMGAPNSTGNGECDAAAIWNGHDLIEGGGTATTIKGTSYAGSVQALNPTTGQPVWQTGLPGEVLGSPAEDGAGVIAAPIFSYHPGLIGVYLLSARTGKILGFLSTQPHSNFAQPVFDRGDLLVGNQSALPLTAYAITRPGDSAPLQVSPATIDPATTVTLTVKGTGDFTAPARVVLTGRVAAVESVKIDSATTATVTIQVQSDAPPGMVLGLTLTEPDLTAYSCTACLTVGPVTP
jgi:polyvinyl alcohol dehydrogenase (cytochrome)